MIFNADKLDTDIRPAVLDVLKVAALLDTPEFKVFALAWSHCFGARPEEGVIEPYFSRYMFYGIVPHWVRHFTRHILKSERSGARLRVQYDLAEPPPSKRLRRLGRIYTAILAAAVLALAMLCMDPEYLHMAADGCRLPPCY